jgi:hypothetical protein
MKTEASLELTCSAASSPAAENSEASVVDADASDFECPICCDLLLDPIVGMFPLDVLVQTLLAAHAGAA